MVSSEENYSLTALGCSQYEIEYTIQTFPYRILAFDEGLKYLDCLLKPNTYKIAYWTWLLAKIQRIIDI